MKHTATELLLALHVRNLAIEWDRSDFFAEHGIEYHKAADAVTAEWRAANPMKQTVEEVYTELDNIAGVGSAIPPKAREDAVKR